jgi:uncharacterized C2H2 Zn-finger protein
MTNALLTCVTCNDIFRSRYDLNNHVRRNHQLSVKVKFQNGGVTEVKRGDDNMFICKCGKKFKLPDSLRRHVKSCREEQGQSENAIEEDVQMREGNSDTSETLNVNEEEVNDTLIDCFGEVIFLKLTNCRG